MEINIEITRSDFANFYKFIYFKKGIKMRIKLVIIIALVYPIILMIIKDVSFEFDVYIELALIMALFFALLLAFGMLINMKLMKKAPDKNGSILGKKKFTITEEGLVEETESIVNLLKWRGIKEVKTNKNYIFILVDSYSAHIIPKRFFRDLDEEMLFLKTIEEKVLEAK